MGAVASMMAKINPVRKVDLLSLIHIYDITRFEYIKRANKGKGPVLIGIALSDKNDYDGLLERLSEFDPSYINLNGNETLYNMLV